MAVTDTEMDSVTVVEIPAFPISFRNCCGEQQVALNFQNFLRVKFSDGTDAIIPSPLKNLEFHDGNANGAGHGLVVFKIVMDNVSQDNGEIVHYDLSNP